MNEIKLPNNITEYLKTVPENGMGYHIVNLHLKDSSILYGRKILNSSILYLEDTDRVNIKDIVGIETREGTICL